jgi:uncharacterized protein YndB with AHSA1/START domain
VEVRREILLEAPPEEVWEAVTDPERLAEWFATEVELEPVEGGEGTFRWGDGSERRAVVEEVDPERRFAFRWREPDGDGETRVELELEEVDAGTVLTVVERPLAPQASAIAGEWSGGLVMLAALARV